MRAGAVLAFVIGVLVAASCGGESSSSDDDGDWVSGNGGTGALGGTSSSGGSATGGRGGFAGTGAGGSAGTDTGGSAGTGTGGSDEDCDDERRALRELINANKACSDTSDCISLTVGCGITEDNCTGTVYTNDDIDEALFDDLRSSFMTCLEAHESTDGCAICERLPRPPTCSEERCVGASACELEAAALWDFKSKNDACETSDDCITEFVGCDVTEDDCTGAVYFAADFDRAEFEALRDEYHSCTGGCGACRRLPSAPACVSGHCQILPTR
jgi:hypothetical protein